MSDFNFDVDLGRPDKSASSPMTDEEKKKSAERYRSVIKGLLKSASVCRDNLLIYSAFADFHGFPKELRNCIVSLSEFISKIQFYALSRGLKLPRDL